MKTIIKIFICLSLIYTPFFAFAGAAEKWEVLENNYDHVTNKVKIEARKITQDAANSGRYKVNIPVNANTLGATAKRMLWAGAAVGAITALVEGVGWVIDHGSQVIKKPLPLEIPPDISDPTVRFLYYFWGQSRYFTTPTELCQVMGTGAKTYNHVRGSGLDLQAYCEGVPIYIIPNPSYDPSVPPNEPKYQIITDTQLGNEILGKGTEPNSRTQPAEDIITDAYSPNNPVQDAPAPQQTLDALENANPEPETEPKGESETEPEIDPETGEQTGKEKTTFKLPNFCSWAPAVCDFFTVQKADNKDIKKNQREQIEQDKTFFEKVAEWFDWSQTDDELPDNESPEIVEHITPDLKEDAISWGSACPADVSIPISMQGVSSTLVFSWSPWCQLLSIIKPAIVASAYIGAAFIVLGLRT